MEKVSARCGSYEPSLALFRTVYFPTAPFLFLKQRYQDSNLEMPESESGALPFGDSARYVGERIRTPDLLVRSQTLYPAELRPHIIYFCIHNNMYYYECRRPESNRYGSLVPQDFKSCASASSATPAYMGPTGLEPVTLCL